MRVIFAAMAGTSTFLLIVSVADRVYSSPQLFVITHQFADSMASEISAESGDLVLDVERNRWYVDLAPAYADHQTLVSDFKHVLDEHDLPYLRNFFAPTAEIRDDINRILMELRNGDRSKKEAIDAAAERIRVLSNDATIAQYVESFSGPYTPIISDHFLRVRESLLKAADSAVVTLEQTVSELNQSINSDLGVNDLNSLISRSTVACRQSRVAFVFVRIVTPVAASDRVAKLQQRFLDAEVSARSIVENIAADARLTSAPFLLAQDDGRGSVAGVLAEYIQHMTYRIEAIQTDMKSAV